MRLIVLSSMLLTALLSSVLTAQPQSIYFAHISSNGPFARSCEGTDSLPANTSAFLYWDVGHDGPGGWDQPPCPFDMLCIPEDFMCNFYTWYTMSGGGFSTDLFQGYYWLMTAEPFFVRIFIGAEQDSCWTSPVFTLFPQPAEFPPPEPQWIWLPASQWTCGPIAVVPPPCDPEPAEINYNPAEAPPVHTCVQTCEDGRTWLLVWNPDDSLDSERPPLIVIESGCEGQQPAPFTFNPATWDYLNLLDAWSHEVVGGAFGYITVNWLTEIPCAVLDSFAAIRIGQQVRLDWTTSSESNLSYFEIWRYASHQEGWTPPSEEVPASGNSGGSSYSWVDSINVRDDRVYWYTLLMVDSNSVGYPARRKFVPYPLLSSESIPAPLASTPSLCQNYPNPFNASTEIEFSLPREMNATVIIYDVLGRSVRMLVDDMLTAGEHRMQFDAHDLPSGVYLYRLEAGEFSTQRKMLLIK